MKSLDRGAVLLGAIADEEMISRRDAPQELRRRRHLFLDFKTDARLRVGAIRGSIDLLPSSVDHGNDPAPGPAETECESFQRREPHGRPIQALGKGLDRGQADSQTGE